MEKITAIVRGEYQYPFMMEPKQFEEKVTFTLYPPKDGEPRYGTGYYMGVDFENGNDAYVDVRYAKTTDIKKLADQYINDYWGKNLREYSFA